MLKRIILVVCTLSVLFSVFSCEAAAPKTETKSRTFYEYFDTVGTFSDWSGMETADFNTLADRVEAELSDYHKLYDIYNEYSGMNNLATVNKNAGKGKIKVDKKIIDLLLFSKEVYEITDGYTNIAMGSVLGIWHEKRKLGKEIPTAEELAEADKHTDIEKLIIDEENLTVELLDEKMSLDVGAVAKGYAVEKIAQMLIGEGRSGLVLDVGGNIRTVGAKPSGEGWKSAVENPDLFSENRYVYYLTVKNEALVTSGDYKRFYIVDGKRYHHIIDKDTLFPSENYASVTVNTESSALADALSTAFFSMEYEKIEKTVNSLGNVFVIIVRHNGEVITVGEND